jgi:hypothetical protein
MHLTKLKILSLLSVIAFSVGANAKQKPVITGRIVAYRPIDRIERVTTTTRQEEFFLFEIEDRKQGMHPAIVKIDYEHPGDSEVTEQTLQGALPLTMAVKRNPICDQSYSDFLSSIPTVKDENSGVEIMRGITFAGKFKKIELSPDLMLKCYVVGKGGIKIGSSAGESR